MIARERPNILFMLADQHRFDWHDLDDALPVHTPQLRRLAEKGVRFTRAITPSPICAPARASIALGAEYGRNGPVLFNRSDLPEAARGRTFYHALQSIGYRVASCGKLDLNKASHSWGRDGLHRSWWRSIFRDWGFTDGFDSEGKGAAGRFGNKPHGPYGHFLKKRGLSRIYGEDFRARTATKDSQYLDTHPSPLPDDAFADNWVGEIGRGLIERLKSDGPWFLQVNFSGPHPPMDSTASMMSGYRDAVFPDPVDHDQHPFEIHQEIRRSYSAMVSNIDRWVGIYIDQLQKLSLLENTILVYSSDHGEMLGDHNRFRKHVPYQPSVGVPLLIAGPGIRRGVTHEGPTTLLDLPATFLHAAGGSTRFADSRSLLDLLRGESTDARRIAYSAYAHWALAFDGRFKLVRGFDPANLDVPKLEDIPRPNDYRLFDLELDPEERRDHAVQHPGVMSELKRQLPDPIEFS